MSLINDVLRDLDRRGAAPSRGEWSAAARPAGRARRRLWPWWLLSAAVAGVLLHLAWRDLGDDPVIPGLPASAGLETPGAKPMRQQSTVLAAQVTRPEALPSAALVASSSDKPGAVVDSTEQAGAPEQPEPPARTDSAAESPVKPSEISQAGSGTVTAGPVPSATADADGEDEPPQTADAVEPVIRIERARAVSSPETESLLAARRALARGQEGLARLQLESRLDQAPGDHEARLLLAQVHQRTGRVAAAGRVLEAGLDQPEPAPIAAALARQLLARDQPERARDLLLAHAPDSKNDADYQLLLGAALRQNGQHEQALALYQSLADTHPRRGQVWIGLGSTLETLHQPQAAREAYQRALQADDPRAIAFARGRLAALPPDTEPAR